MSVPVHRDELEELEAAGKAACACLDLYNRILGEARFSLGSRHFTPAIEKRFRESFGLPWPPPDDQTPSDLLTAIYDLIETLNQGWDAICQADETLLLVTSGPVSAAGVTATSTCRLAGELGISLWNRIRCTDPQLLDPNLHAREPDDPSGSPYLRFTYFPRASGEGPGRFDLREELFRGLEQAFQTSLVHQPQIDAHRLRARVKGAQRIKLTDFLYSASWRPCRMQRLSNGSRFAFVISRHLWTSGCDDSGPHQESGDCLWLGRDSGGVAKAMASMSPTTIRRGLAELRVRRASPSVLVNGPHSSARRWSLQTSNCCRSGVDGQAGAPWSDPAALEVIPNRRCGGPARAPGRWLGN